MFIQILIGALGSPRRIIKGTERLGNKKTSGDYPNYCIIEIGQNTEKSLRDLRRHTVLNSNERPSALTDVKNFEGIIIIIII